MRNRTLAILLAAVVACGGCARRKKPRVPVAARVGHTETGVASWYGEPYHGRRAANGEVYDMEKPTAAHRTLPFGTWVRVGNLTNGKLVVVRITDRGPFVGGRIIDLSRAAARAIDMIGPGTAKVRVTVTRPPENVPEAELFAVQVGAFRERSRADQLRRRMEARHQTARLVRREGSPPMWRVLVGREATIEAAERLAERLRRETGAALVVRLDQVQP
ncbi:MAG: septal ring lytic transglycosylase RlpA family protein [Bryobacterales bacterium]|nr:septal ring lytic transglycosylase RlpA family protein [Bryobacterales bacterium]